MKPYPYDELLPYERKEVRESYEHIQNHACWYCGTHLDDPPTEGILEKRLDISRFPPNFLDTPIHLHHDRDSGLTVGAVHSYCNGVLWQYEGE